MTDLTKLADDLEVIRQSFREMSHADRSPNWFTGGPRAATAHRLMWQRKGLDVADAIDDAAAILRSAAAVDVAGLMAMVDTYAMLDDKDPLATRAALESALRLALAAREGFVMVPVEPTPDMLEAGAGTKYEKRARNVWRDMIAAAAPKGTT